jgi:tRNA(fMet)-specific endonuclease VapC
MTVKYLLDTSTLSVAVAAKPNRTVLARLTQRSEQCAIASVVWNELSYGCERLEPGRRKNELEAYLQDVVAASFPILPYDREAATWHAHERARQERIGRRTPFVDGQLAAVARVNDLILVTANVRDFEQFRDLQVEDWTRVAKRRQSQL